MSHLKSARNVLRDSFRLLQNYYHLYAEIPFVLFGNENSIKGFLCKPAFFNFLMHEAQSFMPQKSRPDLFQNVHIKLVANRNLSLLKNSDAKPKPYVSTSASLF